MLVGLRLAPVPPVRWAGAGHPPPPPTPPRLPAPLRVVMPVSLALSFALVCFPFFPPRVSGRHPNAEIALLVLTF